MVRPIDPENPPYHPPVIPKKSNPGGTPGLITSTGGLFGATGMLVVPFFNNIINKYYAATFDSSNFDCEEACRYNFRHEDGPPGCPPDRAVTIQDVIFTYRQLGSFSLFIGLNAYTIADDKHINVEKKITVKTSNPDNKLHTIKVGSIKSKTSLQITGLRPQLYIRREANSGPFAIVRITMVGSFDEGQQL